MPNTQIHRATGTRARRRRGNVSAVRRSRRSRRSFVERVTDVLVDAESVRSFVRSFVRRRDARRDDDATVVFIFIDDDDAREDDADDDDDLYG